MDHDPLSQEASPREEDDISHHRAEVGAAGRENDPVQSPARPESEETRKSNKKLRDLGEVDLSVVANFLGEIELPIKRLHGRDFVQHLINSSNIDSLSTDGGRHFAGDDDAVS